jgi:hypothetical protein
MSKTKTDILTPLTGFSGITVEGSNTFVIGSYLRCLGGATVSGSNTLAVGSVSSGQTKVIFGGTGSIGITSGAAITRSVSPIGPHDLVHKSYVDTNIFLPKRLVYCSTIDNDTTTESITLFPGDYYFYAEITASISITTFTTYNLTGTVAWPSTGTIVTGTKTINGFNNNTNNHYDTVIVPIVSGNFNVSATTTGTFTRSITATANTVLPDSKGSACTLYIFKV